MRLGKNLAGTRRPIVFGEVLQTSSDGFDGYEIVNYLGMVWGMSVRSKDFGSDCLMGCTACTGGELESYSQLGNESRQKALDAMLEMAKQKKANAIINIHYEVGGLSQGTSQVVANGTAVEIKPIPNYVPIGAIGNVLTEMNAALGSKVED